MFYVYIIFYSLMDLSDLYLSAVLNVSGISLLLVNLRQNEANYATKIRNSIDTLGNEPQAMIVGCTAEG